MRRAQCVIVPSRATAADIASIYPRDAHKTRVVLHGIDPAVAASPEEIEGVLAHHGITRPYVLHVGTVQARKNVDLLVRAVRELRREGQPHQLVVAGRRGWLADRAFTEIERDDTARYVGEVSATDLAALYAGAEVFCSPSAYEGFGFTTADALAAGVPVAVACGSSLPEVCGEACVRIVDLSVEAITAALRPLLADDDARQRLGQAGRERAREFSWQRAARQHAEVYREAARGGAGEKRG